jgi:hypothetical protein
MAPFSALTNIVEGSSLETLRRTYADHSFDLVSSKLDLGAIERVGDRLTSSIGSHLVLP